MLAHEVLPQPSRTICYRRASRHRTTHRLQYLGEGHQIGGRSPPSLIDPPRSIGSNYCEVEMTIREIHPFNINEMRLIPPKLDASVLDLTGIKPHWYVNIFPLRKKASSVDIKWVYFPYCHLHFTIVTSYRPKGVDEGGGGPTTYLVSFPKILQSLSCPVPGCPSVAYSAVRLR